MAHSFLQEAIILQQQAAFERVDHLEYTMDAPREEFWGLPNTISLK